MQQQVRCRHLNIILVFVSALLLAGCGSSYRAPVNELGGTQRFLDAGRTHRVNAGETLYAIAWMYDLDFNALAKANNLPQPFDLSEGQVLVIDLRNAEPAAATRNNNVVATNGVTVNPARTGTGISRTQLPNSTLQRTPLPESSTQVAPAAVPEQTPVVIAPERKVEPEPPAPAVIARAEDSAPAPAPAAPVPEQKPAAVDAPIVWDWPAAGNIVGRFSDSSVDKKGLDIGGKRGDAVKAAADGEVVYTGSGVLLYGDLVIIKHNDRFLSAYAHNDRILVKERAIVKRGDVIAELGSSGIDRNMLHFEIRMDGTPVDPLIYLPAK